MASTKDYLQFILDQLSGLPSITYRKMMGEYILYCNGKIVGGIYDNRLLLKPTNAVKELVDILEMKNPYPGAKSMICVDNVDNSDYIERLIIETYNELYEH